jgi:hypothetical protein
MNNTTNNPSAEQQAVNDMVRSMVARRDDPAARRRLAGLASRPAARPAQPAPVPDRQQPRQVAEAPDLLEQMLWNDLVWENVVLPQRLREEAQGFAGLAEWTGTSAARGTRWPTGMLRSWTSFSVAHRRGCLMAVDSTFSAGVLLLSWRQG